MNQISEVNLNTYLFKIKNNLNLLLFNFISIPIIITIISFTLPTLFTSDAVILPPEESFDPLMYGFTGFGEGYGGGFTRAILGRGTAPELWASMLRSRRIMKPVINKFNLIEKWGLDNIDDAYKNIINILSINISPEGLINMSITLDDPILAKNIASELIINLDKTNQDILQTTARNRKIFIEKRLFQIKDSLTKLENSLVRFSVSYGIFNIESESQPLLEALATLKTQEIIIEAELAGLSSEQTVLHPQRRSIEAQLSTLRQKIYHIESEGGEGFGLGFSVPLKDLPELSMKYAKLKMNYFIQMKLFELLTQELERAKIAELKDTPSLKVVDWPQVPNEKSYPKKSIFLAIGLFLGFSIGIIAVLLKNKFEEELKNNEVRKKWESLIYDW